MDREEQHVREADEHAETAEIDIARSDEVLEAWQQAISATETTFRKNGFGAAMTRIMRAPVRKAS